MKRIEGYRKMFNATKTTTLADLKTVYRNLIKEWHPDKFTDAGPDKVAEVEKKSKSIITAYHFLVSISPETHAANAEEYERVTNTCTIEDYLYKNEILSITFQDGIVYEYFGVPKSVYNKMSSSTAIARFARRHIFHEFTYRNVSKNAAPVAAE